MSSEQTPRLQEGAEGLKQQAELTLAHPDSTTQQHPSQSWDKETLEVLRAYNRYVMESLQDNFDRVMAIAQQVTAAEHERHIHDRCTHVGGGCHKKQQ